MKLLPFLDISRSILEENRLEMGLGSNVAVSFPVLAYKGGEPCDALFLYRQPAEPLPDEVGRPLRWLLLGARTGELMLLADCALMDFVPTQSYPLDSPVLARPTRESAGRDYARHYQELFMVYESLRDFPFSQATSPYQNELLERYRQLFEMLAPIGHYPFYQALSPEFFQWVGLELCPPSKADEKAGPEEFPQEPPEEPPRETDTIAPAPPPPDAAAPDYSLLILENLRQLIGQAGQFQEISRQKQRVIDRLHQELQEYKNGVLDKLTLSMELDVIKVIDDTRRTVEALGARQPGKETSRLLLDALKAFAEDLGDLLFRQGIAPYEVEGEQVDVKRQVILSTVPTDNPRLDKTLATRYSSGWIKGKNVIRPQRIAAYIYKEPSGGDRTAPQNESER